MGAASPGERISWRVIRKVLREDEGEEDDDDDDEEEEDDAKEIAFVGVEACWQRDGWLKGQSVRVQFGSRQHNRGPSHFGAKCSERWSLTGRG